MPEPKFTPGPWDVELGGQTLRVVEDDGDEYRNDLAIIGNVHDDTVKANAHLIAAAPDLYAALEQTIEALETLHAACVKADIRGCDCRSAYAWDNAHDALRKARGES